ncbi:MAG: hypothetical protein FD141_214 [Fusobacteria bacterium]|nr:MAG: hypothetical protein FD141_214 [Fusobacteriota bacterium]KAF0229122.1 MAG: hypothetical protein FD182_1378 [Fusobacteriota bacterium]
MKNNKKELTTEQIRILIELLRTRFDRNITRHEKIDWNLIEDKLILNPDKLWSLSEMERTGGEPDVVGYDESTNEYIIYDCSLESPIGRRNLCYDKEALESRKENKPVGSALGLAEEMGIEILTEEQYRELQQLGEFDKKTSSWVKTPDDVRKLGGVVFCDLRYGRIFLYHNGASSYYGVRGFRGSLRV